MELEAQRLQAEEARLKQEADRAHFNDEVARLRQQLEASRKSAEEALLRFEANLQTQRD